jgi:hypothetical protein
MNRLGTNDGRLDRVGNWVKTVGGMWLSVSAIRNLQVIEQAAGSLWSVYAVTFNEGFFRLVECNSEAMAQATLEQMLPSLTPMVRKDETP